MHLNGGCARIQLPKYIYIYIMFYENTVYKSKKAR